jgi:hypothetical protein
VASLFKRIMGQTTSQLDLNCLFHQVIKSVAMP